MTRSRFIKALTGAVLSLMIGAEALSRKHVVYQGCRVYESTEIMYGLGLLDRNYIVSTDMLLQPVKMDVSKCPEDFKSSNQKVTHQVYGNERQ